MLPLSSENNSIPPAGQTQLPVACWSGGPPTADELDAGAAVLVIRGHSYWVQRGDLTWILRKFATGAVHYVSRDTCECTCNDRRYRQGECKHMAALRDLLPQLPAAADPETGPEELPAADQDHYVAYVAGAYVERAEHISDMLAALRDLTAQPGAEDVAVWRGNRCVCVLRADGSNVWLTRPKPVTTCGPAGRGGAA